MNLKRSLSIAGLAGLMSASFGLGRSIPLALGLEPAPVVKTDVDVAQSLSNAFQEVSAKAGPSVVSVKAYGRSRRGRALAQGSGVIIDRNGLTVTNNHVVEQADRIIAVLSDGRQVTAELVGRDVETDLAVLRLEADDLTPSPLRIGIEPKVGEWVVAIGNPLGLGHTVTAGIVSGRGRSDLGIATYEDFIQTDTAINPGNSGGPLLDLEGAIIGINTAIGATEQNRGIAFAIPSRMVRKVVDAILDEGLVRRGWLGVEMRDLSDDIARRIRFDGDSRVQIRRIIPDGPAEVAGVEAGDIVLAVGNSPVDNRKELLNAIADIRPGKEVNLNVWRAGTELNIPVTMAERENLEFRE